MECEVRPFDAAASEFRQAVMIAGSQLCLSPHDFLGHHEDIRNGFLAAIDHWVPRFAQRCNGARCHGFDATQWRGRYKNVWVFKCEHNKTMYRLYGFIDHPCTSRPRLEVFVAASIVAKKPQHDVEERDLRTVLHAYNDHVIRSTLRRHWNPQMGSQRK